ncbi:MAG: hypothetical protein PHS07_02940 [Patescibacteria group bacterium]|jgi:type IV secretory pathway VirB2 component (pilin)|nr:hypothetical protein [Patescibacteria group bacterium]
MTYKKIIIGIILSLSFFNFLIIPILAQTNASPSTVSISNPIPENDPKILVGKIIKAFLGFLGTIALVMVIYGGFMWMTSAGNETKIEKGKNTLLWAVIGLATIFLSYTILTMVFNALEGKPIFG